MSEPHLNINTVFDNKIVLVPYNSTTTAEDVCVYVCKQLNIGTIARHLFALRISGKQNFLRPSALFTEKNNNYDLRIRFKIANISKLRKIDPRTYDYYFHQARNDVLENKVPDIICEKYRRELVGLGITDMYRVMLEKDIPRETVENEYKKYIPKEVLKRHSFFIKKPIHDTLGKLQKSVHDAKYVKAEYLKQLDIIAPEYLSEMYKAVTDEDGAVCTIHIKVTPHHPTEPGVKYCLDSKKDQWTRICTIEELGFISIRDDDGTVEISRKNGIPFYLKFSSLPTMFSFISLLDGYYRLTCKWTFNICKDVPTPSLQKLYAMKCHGPVGGEFSYAKLEEKRGNRPGCFIIRESESKYNNYYIDVCMKDSSKPKTFKLERITGDEFIFNDDLNRYRSIQQLMAAYNDPNGAIFLQECLPPSEYDKSPLLLCQSDNLAGDSLTDSSTLNTIIPPYPLCINCKDLQVYKGKFRLATNQLLKMLVILIFAFVPFSTFASEDFGNITDFTTCKVSHLGLEYRGDVAKSESWVRCQSWSSNDPHNIPESITDEKFSDFSRKRARNYCRNPTKNPDGPWCYTMNLDLKYETCGLPLCSIDGCKVTGPGMEYSGQHNKGLSDRKCLKWNKDRNKVKEGNSYKSYEKFEKTKFPEGNVAKAKKYCRNPNGDIGGPWCFVENEDTDEIEKEYCEIPFCHEAECEVFSGNTQKYTHYTDFNDTLTKMTFGLKLWDSDSYLDASARLVLTLMALPLNGKEIQDLGIGLEIYISNKGCALTFGNKDRPEYEKIHNVLKSTEYTMFSLSWTAPFISLSLEGQIKPIFLAEYKTKGNLLGFKKNIFNFYSFQGTNVLWSFPFCMDDFECDVHTTTGAQFQQFWPLRSNEVGRELQFYLRAVHSTYLLFVPSPTVDYPNTKFVIQHSNQISRVTVNFVESSTVVVKELALPEILDYWNWHEFSIAFFANTMQFYWTKSVGTQMIFELEHEIFRQMRWFSPSSDTIAHWTFFCVPPDISKPPPALLPECALNKKEENYEGTQDVTSSGLPCLPWSGKKLLPSATEDYFPGNSSLKAWNYCRNPSQDPEGTFCYTFNADKSIEKSFCRIRKCKSEDCRMAGTGNDYIGTLTKTRSNRSCDSWFENVTVHQVEVNYINISLYPDLNLEDVKNYCRNPSRDIGGSWCYTNDPEIVKDLCNVRDCDQPEENIIITTKARERKVYVLPQWKISGLEFGLKQWNPDRSDGVQFDIYPPSGGDKIQLLLGANNNEKIKISHNGKIKKEKSFPHLISSGKWADFWLVMRQGEISLGFKGVPNSFFEYKNDDIFDPMFISYGTIMGNPIGFFFKNDQCQTEKISTSDVTKIMPIGLWSETEKPIYRNFSLMIRGNGVVLITLMALPNFPPFYSLRIDSKKREISLSFNDQVLDMKSLQEDPFTSGNWTNFQISFNENYFNVTKNNDTILMYGTVKAMLFYWFSVGVTNGWMIWSANCEPLDIDGPPRDGGWSAWSPWHCTVSCGGGEGFRTRTCTNPKPNILGKLCKGSHKSTGSCNNFICGDVNPTTMEKIRENLQTHQYSFVIEEGRSLVLENDHEMLKIIKKESPDAYYEWTFNGIYIKPSEDHIFIRGDDLVIRHAEYSDSGVYVCMLYRVNKKRMVMKVIGLAVITDDYTVKTRATRSLILPCNAVILGYIYSDLSLKLYLNGEVYKDFGITMLAAVNSEHFDHLNMSHHGDWKCVVEQKDLKLSWVTNYVRVEVKKAPNFYTNLMEDEMTKPVFGWLKTENNVIYALIFIAGFAVFLAILFVFIYCQKKEGSRGITTTYRSMWKITKGKKIEVAMKILKQDSCDKYLKEFLELAGQYAHLQSSAIVRLFGITLSSNVSLVLEYFRLGPLDQYLREHKGILKKVDLIEAASNLASALWHLKENDIVHGNIRCRKLMVNTHDENSFTVKLTDPGIHIAYASKEVHWIPVECYTNLDYAKRSTAADVWAFATTLWEIFMFGEEIKVVDHLETMRWYLSGKRLSQPRECDKDIYDLMRECWNADPHRRKQPQAIMRDINQILYQVYNSRRTHSYAKLFTKSNSTLQTVAATSTNSLTSNVTQSTFMPYSDDLVAASEVESNSSAPSSFNSQSQNWIMNSQELLLNCEDSYSCDFSNILSNFNFSTATTSLDSINSLQSIFELDQDCNVVLQGRIGQGFYGEVYKGTLEYPGNQDMDPRIVAIKKLKATALSSGLQDFEREINIMKTLQHPNIVEILGVLREPDISLVMEFVQHGSLQSYLKINRESLHTKQLLKYALDIAKGMDYLGKKNIVHRDLAARNILVVDENHVKISDFGLAQVMGTNDYYILKTSRELPIKWYAPESLRDGKFSVRSDVWSYGVTMCEMFNCGEEPTLVNLKETNVEGQEQQVLLHALETGARFPCPPMCPQAVYIRIIYPCWRADPHERPRFEELVLETQDLLTQY